MTRKKIEKMRQRPVSDWTREEAYFANRFIREAILRAFRAKLRNLDIPKPLRNYINFVVDCHFNTSETQTMFDKMGCIEKWMVPEERH